MRTGYDELEKSNHILKETNIKRISIPKYRKMEKPELIKAIQGFKGSLEHLRMLYADILIENSFLKRKIDMLEKKIKGK